MKAKVATLAFVASFSSVAYAGELTLGEMSTGAIIEDQDILLTPNFTISKIGLNDNVELGTFLLGNVAGIPNLGARFGILDDDDSMLAVTTWFGYEMAWEDTDTGEIAGDNLWFFTGVDYTMQAGDNWLTFSGGAGLIPHNEGWSMGGSNVSVYYLILNGATGLEFEFWSDPYALSQEDTAFLDATGLSGTWFMARETLRFGAGLDVMGTDDFTENHPLGGIVDWEAPIIAMPHVYLAFRF